MLLAIKLLKYAICILTCIKNWGIMHIINCSLFYNFIFLKEHYSVKIEMLILQETENSY